jgi:group I intron endonuclease
LIERINVVQNDKEPQYYIGKSNDIFNRLAQHCDGNEQFIDKEIKKKGITNFNFKILEVVKKEADRNIKERFYIDSYIEKFGEKRLYNNESGGDKGKKRINKERVTLSNEVKKEIKTLFEEDLGRSIYTVAEKYDIHWKDVCDIRKPLLIKNGLCYKNRQIVDKEGNVPQNWRGNEITQKQKDCILSNYPQDKDGRDIIKNACNLSITDLNHFLEIIQNHE